MRAFLRATMITPHPEPVEDATLLMQHCSCLGRVCGSTLQSCRQSDVAARAAWS